MCSISGIFAPGGPAVNREELLRINRTMKNRGPDRSAVFIENGVGLAHNRLAVMDPENGHQPMTVSFRGNIYTIVYNGELYNTPQLRRDLEREGVTLATHCDTEVLLYSYACWGRGCLERLNGIYAFAVYDRKTQTLFCARDRLGVKPFYYATAGNRFLFASEPKGLLAADGIRPRVNWEGLWQLLFMTPVMPEESGMFEQIHALPPGHCLTVDRNGNMHKERYWKLTAAPVHASEEEIIDHTRALLTDAIRRQMVSDVPLCTFLSGGLDSSVVSAVGAAVRRENGTTLSTYSFEYEHNRYAPTLFQPAPDDAYAIEMAAFIGSEHTVLRAPSQAVADLLEAATDARDFPGQADIDSSLYYFCSEVRRRHTVALSGECADEIFGGYPWFYRPEMVQRDFFPWIHAPMERVSLFRPEVVLPDEGYAYARQVYLDTVADCDLPEDDSPDMRTARIATNLSMRFFMTSLLERKDRMSMAHGLEVRVPFADHRIAEFVYNVPWSIKFASGVEKALLRNAMRDYLPESIFTRKKSPYPKTHDPHYEELVRDKLLRRLKSSDSRLASLLAPGKLQELLERREDATWFGQLMSRPQLLAWLLQLDHWLSAYHVEADWLSG